MNSHLMAILMLLTPLSAVAAPDSDRFANTQIDATPLRAGLYMLTGSGGNIGVSTGPDGVLLVDDQFAPLAEKIQAKLNTLVDGEGTPKLLINTHYHGDHTGGNAIFGQHATLMSHHNVRQQMHRQDPDNLAALPVLTFGEGVDLHFNGLTVEVRHLGVGHTDGDAVVWFKEANVLHTGDLFFHDRFPYIDQDHGGTVRGYLARVETLLTWTNDQTQIIPGHGDLATRDDLIRFAEMIRTSLSWAEALAGQPKAQWQQQGLPTELKSWSWAFIDEGRWIDTLWREMQ
ncbi:MBL fold metallo-hydrolase [Ferrimonas gelatinilytica]|uniref:MBL fold metallo-hydrolase n=1 Tax=Ferrimonas gelatinilytica TaxID=1255257 RepID=A0ABP9RZP4_9GAMM